MSSVTSRRGSRSGILPMQRRPAAVTMGTMNDPSRTGTRSTS